MFGRNSIVPLAACARLIRRAIRFLEGLLYRREL